MAIITVPAKFGFSKISFKLQRATNILRSKYTGQAQRISYPYAVWAFDGTLIEYDGIDAGYIRSFLVQLEGQKNSFRFQVPAYVKPATQYASNGLANGTTLSRASSISLRNLTANTPIFNEGDYFTVNDELKIVTAAAASNGSGVAVISFKPALRKQVNDGTLVILQNPTVLMTAKDDDIADWSIGPPIRQGTKLSAIESIDI